MGVYDNYVCDGQMSIFDSLETLPEQDMIDRLENACGITLKPQGDGSYEFKRKGFTIRVYYGRYRIDDETKYIGCSLGHKTGGCSCPCDTVDEAIKRIWSYLHTIEKGDFT